MTSPGRHAIPRPDIDASAVRPPGLIGRSRYEFPDPRLADSHGLVAMGGDFAPETIVEAYRRGIFPWPQEDLDELWFSPDPRAIIPIGGLHVSRRLARTIRQGRFRITIDQAFARVVEACARRDEGTWITAGYRRAYLELHELGVAHSFEAWREGRLAGGLYGLAVGGLFGAESMFHAESDASKVAMAAMMQYLQDRGFVLADVQLLTPHLARMGAIEIARDCYLDRATQAAALPARFCVR